ncbi:hypothetical protein A2U01_0071003, partial [Trifolium medium]|nr:hypothetical protein [Trifolium medium]
MCRIPPSIINNILKISDEPHPDVKVSDNKKYAILNRIAAVNWVPTRHSSDVATG